MSTVHKAELAKAAALVEIAERAELAAMIVEFRDVLDECACLREQLRIERSELVQIALETGDVATLERFAAYMSRPFWALGAMAGRA